MKIIQLSVVIFLGLFFASLAACGVKQEEPIAPQISSTMVVEATAKPTETFTPPPSKTPKPSLTPTLKPVLLQPSVDDNLLLSLTPPILRVTATAITPIATWDGAIATYISPDKKWIAKLYDDYPLDKTEIVSADSLTTWTVQYSEEELMRLDLSGIDVTFRPRHWSIDGRYVYLSASISGDGPNYFCDGFILHKLDLLTGELTAFHPNQLAHPFSCYDFSFSPDETWFSYFEEFETPLILHLRNLKTGAKKQIPLDVQLAQASSSLWSPKENKLVFTGCTQFMSYKGECWFFSLIQIDLNDLSIKTLIPNANHLFPPQELTARVIDAVN